MNTVIIDGNSLTLEQLVQVARFDAKVQLSEQAKKAIQSSRDVVDYFVDQGIVSYGITTGFGKFSDIAISKEDTSKLQENLIISHAVGVGKPFSNEVVRGMMLLRANSLSKGNSGIRLSTVQLLLDMLNAGVIPVVPEKGSLGASGDLAPLSHMVLPMLGFGKAIFQNQEYSGAQAMAKANLEPIMLSSKEGLSLINGTQAMTSVAALSVYDAINLLKLADITACLTIEALNGITCAFDARIHEARGHVGQMTTAKNFLALLDGSQSVKKQGQLRVQDPYSLRCLPQIHGASKDAIGFIKAKVDIELNAVTDNPLIFKETKEVISGGNFHGQPIALPMDFLAIALSELANISERRMERLVNPALSFGLPAFLVEQGGLNNGFMIVQYSAASLVSENKILAHPASVDSIPSSANQEDHVSMGTIAARKANEILHNVQAVISMELLAACQAIDMRKVEKLGKGTQIAYDEIRKVVDYMPADREIKLDMELVDKLVADNTIVAKVEEVIKINI